MAPVITSETKSLVLAYTLKGLSSRQIVEKLLDAEDGISQMSVIRIIKDATLAVAGIIKPKKAHGPQCLPVVRTKRFIGRVKKAISVRNPPSQVSLARKLKVSRATIQKVLKVDLEIAVHKKTTTHSLTEKQAEQRLQKGDGFLDFLTPRKLRYILTFDETYISLEDTSAETDYYYDGDCLEIPDDWKKKPRKSWPRKIMVVIGICWYGKTKAYIVPEKAKVNADYFIQHILKPIVEKDIPRIYGDLSWKVRIHMDSAPGHVAKKTYEWLDERNVKYISKLQWMANSPDLSPMDYGVNGHLKEILRGKQAKDLKQLERMVKLAWAKYDLAIIQKILLAWPIRVSLMIQNHGYQTAHVL